MSAPVTEAHRELARRIMFEFTQAGTATASDVRMAAQIIADSEARACDQLRAEVERLRHLEALLNQAAAEVTAHTFTAGGIAGLRAENERLRRAYVRPDDIRAQLELAIARAERAEAELAAERVQAKLWEDKCHELIAPHYILDPCLRAHRFREALQFHPVLNNNPTPFWKKYGGPNDT